MKILLSTVQVLQFSNVPNREINVRLDCRRTFDACILEALFAILSITYSAAGKLPLEIPAVAIRHLAEATIG